MPRQSLQREHLTFPRAVVFSSTSNGNLACHVQVLSDFSRRHIRLLPVRDKIFTLMRRAQVLRFNEITTQVPGVSIEEIFPHLRQCSRAIDGILFFLWLTC